MRRIAVYGKGGIGKSTITANLSLTLARGGSVVMQIGCDPKADSTFTLLNGRKIDPVLEQLRHRGMKPALEDLVVRGAGGVLCVEAGGPEPGTGCAGRGIVTTLEYLAHLKAFERLKPDYVFFDVLGDVVCGGFAAPIREGWADEVIIVTSGEKMSLYAAENIIRAVRRQGAGRGVRLAGLVVNCRGIPEEAALTSRFALENDIDILSVVPREPGIQKYEMDGRAILDADPASPLAGTFLALACRIKTGAEAGH